MNTEAATADPQLWNRYSYARSNPLRFCDPDGREVALLYGHATSNPDNTPSSNPFGHIAISINGQVFSFGTNYTDGGPNTRDWNRSEATYLAAQDAKRETERMVLDVSASQEQELLAYLKANNPNAPGAPSYSIEKGNTCVSVVERALVAVGIFQVELSVDLRSGFIFPRNSTLPAELAARARRNNLVKSTSIFGGGDLTWMPPIETGALTVGGGNVSR